MHRTLLSLPSLSFDLCAYQLATDLCTHLHWGTATHCVHALAIALSVLQNVSVREGGREVWPGGWTGGLVGECVGRTVEVGGLTD